MPEQLQATAGTPVVTAPFARFVAGPLQREPLRQAITAAWRRPEPELLPGLLEQARLDRPIYTATQALAQQLARQLRERKPAVGRAGLVQGLLQEYALSSQEGVALMCLAEALLRIPDAETRDALIRDKVGRGEWTAHLGRSPSLFVNAATWGLLLTGKLVATHSEAGLSATLGALVRKGGEPLIRKGVDMAMRLMGEQFVTGETIEEALEHARVREAQGFRYSYDMLGEAALTAEDAQRYLAAYEAAIHAIGRAANGAGVHAGPGISIKLSALHPRYSRAQYQRVVDELYPVLLGLAQLARSYNIGLNIDAEEADRLELSLDLLEKLCFAPELAGFDGIGFVVQAYQKRCPYVIDFVVDLARRSGHRLMVRLVKGAYWDSEIKRAQLDGMSDYPVYTRKAHTDVAYLACARRLLAAPDAVYPQFATHNAHTLAAIYHLADPARYQPGQYEFQCLHGMGEPLYEQVVSELKRPCRIYAPVGTHETLLAYLVRRLLENGANTSFVHQMADPNLPIEQLVQDPVDAVVAAGQHEGQVGLPHPAIALPADLYGAQRANSAGLDLANESALQSLQDTLQASASVSWQAQPMLAQGAPTEGQNPFQPVRNPADARDTVGQAREASAADVELALQAASDFAPAWAAVPPAERAAALDRAADAMQSDMPRLMGLLMREAGKTAANAIAEVREAIDFLRYYAAQVRHSFDNTTHVPLGPVVCISPWNFPLAIFTGQVAAALAAGNTVLAKPAEQTPLVAAEAVWLLRDAGVPPGALQLLPGRGETVGAPLVADRRVQGVMFTGSTEVARLLQRSLAQRLGPTGQPVPLIAETGGQNAMIVDASALPEQVVNDVVASAFDSAGQRCSALRVLCLQNDVADRVLAMLRGAMAELRLGNPGELAVDVGPVIDAEARDNIQRHIATMRARGHMVFQAAPSGDEATRHGTFVPPTLIELSHIGELEREVFGPVLHVVRYARRDLGALIEQINATGYGLTLGVHTRIDETIAQVVASAHAGNRYVNRNMVGAVVGVQPFGGEGLSGTGPKAGGPIYLYRLLAQRPANVLNRALGWCQNAPAAAADKALAPTATASLLALHDWANQQGRADLAATCQRFSDLAWPHASAVLAGPTGERNEYSLHPRDTVLCLAAADDDRLVQLAAVLAVDGRTIWPAKHTTLREQLPEAVRERIDLVADWQAPAAQFDAVLHHGTPDELRQLGLALAQRSGAIVGVQGLTPGDTGIALERLVTERSLSVNTAAAGGNASLMTLD
jgi:RHH-type proline utilization regulon transcriptional repressor/proline dehydrogenase/delta 1-pyrroline-5-carboxylate dehydrogenase